MPHVTHTLFLKTLLFIMIRKCVLTSVGGTSRIYSDMGGKLAQ